MKTNLLNKIASDIRYEQHHKGGLDQLAFGLHWLILMAAFQYSMLILLASTVVAFIYPYVRKRCIYPRVGIATMSALDYDKSNLRIWTGAVCLVLALTSMYFIAHMSTVTENQVIVGGVVLGIGFLILIALSYLKSHQRNILFYSQFGFLILILTGVLVFHISDVVAFQISIGYGVLNLLMGIIRFVRFIVVNPVIEDET